MVSTLHLEAGEPRRSVAPKVNWFAVLAGCAAHRICNSECGSTAEDRQEDGQDGLLGPHPQGSTNNATIDAPSTEAVWNKLSEGEVMTSFFLTPGASPK